MKNVPRRRTLREIFLGASSSPVIALPAEPVWLTSLSVLLTSNELTLPGFCANIGDVFSDLETR